MLPKYFRVQTLSAFSPGIVVICTAFVSISSAMISVSSPNSTSVVTIKDRTLVRTDVIIQGYLVVAKPADACRQLAPPPVTKTKNSQDVMQWILLANLDDSCSISHKAKNAKKAGYAAILVKNIGTNSTGHWVPSVGKFGTSSSGTEESIYTGVVGEHDGDLLRKKYNWRTQSTLSIQFEAPWKTVYYFALFGCLFIAFVFICWFLRMYVFNSFLPRTYPGLVDRYRQLERTITQRIVAFRLQRLPVQKWTNFEEGPVEICAICLDEFTCEDLIRILNCSHVFHTVCIDPWLIFERHRCPICISNVFARKPKATVKPYNNAYPENDHSILLTVPRIPSSDSSSISTIGSNASRACPSFMT